MSKRNTPNKTTQQIKEEQINFLLEDVEKNLEEYKKAIDLKEKHLSDATKILLSAKKGYDKTIAENKEVSAYIENIKQRSSQYQQQQEAKLSEKEREYYEQKQPKKYKKAVYEEERYSEPELEEEDYVAEEAEEEPEIKKQKRTKKNEKIVSLII